MKKIYRNMLLFTAAVVFLATAPLIVLYAMGYRLQSTTTVDPLPVGVLLIETIPEKATISIDGETVGQSPHAVSNVKPGTVHVAVSKEGYIPWEKNVVIEPGRVAEFRSIRLFPTTPEVASLLTNSTSFALAPNRELIAVATSVNQLHIIDDNGKAIMTPLTLPRGPTSLLWSPDSTSLILNDRFNQPALLEVTSGKRTPLPVALLGRPKDIVWDPRIPARLLLLAADGTLRAYSLSTKASALISRNVSSFAVSSRQIFTAHPNGTLTKHTLQGEVIETHTLKVPPTEAVTKLLITPAGVIALQTDADQLYLFDAASDTLTSIADRVTAASWSPNGQLLLIQQAASTLYVYNVSDERLLWVPPKELHLVVRQSRPVSHVQWFAGNRHLIYQIEDEIVLSEIDTRDHPITHTLDTTNIADAHTAVGRDGGIVFYITAPPGQQTTLVSSKLLE